ncbi:MAG: hypothetical protein AB7T48_02740 [Solirubrobacterales bacterium]
MSELRECPRCQHPVNEGARGRCRGCGAELPVPDRSSRADEVRRLMRDERLPPLVHDLRRQPRAGGARTERSHLVPS